MNTEPATAAQKLAQHGGVWVGLDQHLFKKRIERLAVLAGHIDFTKAAIRQQRQDTWPPQGRLL